jgi:hypothetical protein
MQSLVAMSEIMSPQQYLKKMLADLNRQHDLRVEVTAILERVDEGLITGERTIRGNNEEVSMLCLQEGSSSHGGLSLVEHLRREFKKDKLRKMLIQHRLRLCTLSKKEYVTNLYI